MTSAGGGVSYEMVVGLEVHVQLKTRTKTFCSCSTDFGAPPNANTCPVCLALPGALPVLNEQAVALAVRAALALGSSVQHVSEFARKNYFYPDLPKGYQISQFEKPLATGGSIAIGTGPGDGTRRIRLTRLHLEEDAGKSVHDRFPAATAIDLNRAGVPLVEIVSEPEIRSPAEARAFLATLKQILEYAAVSDVNMERGSLRVDANISSRPSGQAALGVKTEVKNMNSFSAVERALEAEFARQCAILAGGGNIQQQTMLWDARTQRVLPARLKEGSHDYRYFPDPDLPPLLLTHEYIEGVRSSIPELPRDRVARFGTAYPDLTTYDVEVLTAAPALGDYFEHVARTHGNAKTAANWVMGEVLAALRATGRQIETFGVRPGDLAELLDMARDGTVSNTAAKQILAEMIATGELAPSVAQRLGLLRVGDDAALGQWLDEVMLDHPDEARRFLEGERRLQGVLVGLVMKRSGGRADPRRINELLALRAAAQ